MDTLQELRAKSDAYRRATLEMIHRAGAGHTGGDLSCVDILNVLYNRVLDVSPARAGDPDRDRFVMSKGHSVEALYAVLAERGFFPAEELTTLCGSGSKYVGHPTRSVPGIEQNTGALGHGLPLAVGMALAAKRGERAYRVFALLGDGELAEGSNWEASIAAAHYGLDNLTVIVDRNGLQISGSTEYVCALEPLEAKFEAFGYAVREVDGHDLAQLMATFADLPLGPGKPSLVIARTVKGKGVAFIENRASWHHHVPTDDELARARAELGQPVSQIVPAAPKAAPAETCDLAPYGYMIGKPNQKVFADTLLDIARADANVVVVTSDSRGSGKLTAFADELPEQLVEVGIAEQDLVGIAAGLASAGRNVFAVSPACFLTARALEQIKNDVAYSDNPVRLVGISAGVSYGALGSTHHSLHDLAALRAINNVELFAPADNAETAACLRHAYGAAHPVYIRLGKRAMFDLHAPDDEIVAGRASQLRPGDDAALVATGETTPVALAASHLLEERGVSCRVLSMHTLRPLDADAVLDTARVVRAVVTLEEHSVNGGLGDACASLLMRSPHRPAFDAVGIPDEYTYTGSQLDIFDHYGITPGGLVRRVASLLKGERP